MKYWLKLLILLLSTLAITADDDGDVEPVLAAPPAATEYAGDTDARAQTGLPLFALHFVMMASHEKAVASATPERLGQIEDLLNHKFASTTGEHLARFKIRSFVSLDDLKNSTCPKVYEAVMANAKERFNLYWKCKDPKIKVRQGITIFIKHHDKDKLSYGGRMAGMPFAQINWERFRKDERVFLHELGHVFGLGHSCPPEKGSGGRPNVMNFKKGCHPLPEGEAGWLYTPSQAEKIKKRRDAYAKQFAKIKDPLWDKILTDSLLTR